MHPTDKHMEIREQFHLRHGGDEKAVVFTDRAGLKAYIYPDGAMMEFDHWQPPQDVPDNAFLRLTRQLSYCNIKLAISTKAFKERKDQLAAKAYGATTGKGAAPPHETEIEELKRLQEEVLKWRDNVRKLTDDLEYTQEMKLRREAEKREDEQRQAAYQIASVLGGINI